MTTAPTNTGLPRLGVAPLTQYLAAASRLDGAKRRVVLLRSTPQWDGPAELTWNGGQRAAVATAPSPLAVHELVLGHLEHPAAGAPAVLVVLTDREEPELDPGLLARAHRGRIDTVDSWEVVRESFGAAGVDSRLKDSGWAAEALLDATPPGGWPQVPGGPLSARHALTQLALRRLRLGRYDDADADVPRGDALDVHALLRWTLTGGGPERLLALRGPERAGLAAFLGEPDQAGLAGRVLLCLVDAGHGTDAAAFGLVAAALWGHAEADAEVYRARGRAEQWLGERPPATGEDLDTQLATFGRACEEYLTALLAQGRSEGEPAREARRISGPLLERAGVLARQFGAESAAASSPVLALGFEARFTEVGHALGSGAAGEVSAAVHILGKHELARDADARARIERARMAQRLTQWLAGDPDTEVETVAGGTERHLTETGWVDSALEHLEAGGDPDPVLSAAYDALGSRVRERRRAIDGSFARRLATWTEAGTGPGSMLTVETFLDRVVSPVVKGANTRRVLLLLLDGMSAAIAGELGEELRASWAEYDPVPAKTDPRPPRRRAMAAALPTVTAVSRTSLFAGTLMKGTQADEKRLFPAHRFWGGAPAAVFHKDDLRGDSTGGAFSSALIDALSDDRTHVAVVLNTVDDRLAKEQKLGNGSWSVDEIGGLRELLRTAAAQGMAVLLTSDHGHLVDRRSEKVETPGGTSAVPGGTGEAPIVESARHRLPGGPLHAAEVALSGPRVVWPEPGSSIVALWDADTRYTARKAGYHGGAAMAEFTIPVLAFLPFGATPPKDWRELGPQRPTWWLLGSATAEPPTTARAQAPTTTPKKPTPKQRKDAAEVSQSHSTLFEMALVPALDESGTLFAAAPVSPDSVLLSALLCSEVFAAQFGVLARKPPAEQVEKALAALLESGGTLPVSALAQRAGLPAARADGFAAVLRQLLNYDGVQVLETLPDGRTVRLHTGLLKEQFLIA
ncbi:BREX-2 system phosphatase PglZ [Streptomyces sp. NPDC005708]|uniref:BREX-2 system phosphatase PglZ n=1 Tax=Streptomyces sp. NPDC005708 TaxID=3154564 RepID=UPI003403C16F